jgi:hypothetical protein
LAQTLSAVPGALSAGRAPNQEINMKSKEKTPGFRLGRGGACEATLFRFLEPAREESGRAEKAVAATTIDEAFHYVRRQYPEFRIAEIRASGLIEMLSGSPID